MKVILGSARHDENGHAHGGKPGDQIQTSTNDFKGEVSMQDFYITSKGWYVIRAKTKKLADKLAERMKTACNNPNIGYNQDEREQVVRKGIDTKEPVNSDCSALVRACIKEASGKDPGDFYTGNEVSVLAKTGLFEDAIGYTSITKLYVGDILVTKVKGHTAIVVQGNERTDGGDDTPDKPENPYTEPTTNVTSKANAKKYNLKNYIWQGEGVKWVQWELSQAGYVKEINDAGGIDGDCGAVTTDCIKAYQKANKLTMDGICGKKTREKMKND